MAKIKITTKPEYKQGYEAAQGNQPRRSPYRPDTNRETMWLEGYNAFQNGGSAPEEPRKRRTKAEMAEAKANPMAVQNFNEPSRELSPALMIKRTTEVSSPNKPREKGILEKLFDLQDQMKTETDPELLEVITMEHADLEWIICMEGGPKPSTRWEEYKKEKGLFFDRTAA